MKTRLVFLVMLIFCFSCGTNNKPLSDAQKEEIKGEVKEVANAMFKGCEEANVNMAVESFLDSPDFIYIYNGLSFNYKEVVDVLNPLFGELINQEVTITDEKYIFLDKSTVIYTTNCKFLENYKDGHAIVSDPMVVQVTFKKINDKWKAINGVESSVRQNVASESSKGLNQAELLKKFVGNWEAPAGKDTFEFIQFKSLQENKVLSAYGKVVTKGKVLNELTGFWGYDTASNKIDLSIMVSNGYVYHYIGEFTSPDKLELFDVNKASGNKFTFEFNSPDEFKETTIENNKTSSRIVKRVK